MSNLPPTGEFYKNIFNPVCFFLGNKAYPGEASVNTFFENNPVFLN